MKLIAFILTLGCLTLQAQTNLVTFPTLLSVTNTVLMTNATFRCAVAGKLFFQSGDDEHGYLAETLDTNVLVKLGLNLQAMKAAQAGSEAMKRVYWERYQEFLAQQAEQAREQQAAQEEAAAEQAKNAQADSGGQPSRKHPKPPKAAITSLLPQQ
jgi:hypothetical protein